MQGLSHAVHESITEFNEGDLYKVPQERLDDLHSSFGEVKGIKIDVENFEYFVFEGGREMLREWGPVIYCELWDNENRVKCFALLRKLGYQVKVLHQGKLAIFDPQVHQNQNFYFVKD